MDKYAEASDHCEHEEPDGDSPTQGLVQNEEGVFPGDHGVECALAAVTLAECVREFQESRTRWQRGEEDIAPSKVTRVMTK